MSGIARASEKMKKKISFGDYAISSEVNKLQESIAKPAGRKLYLISKEDFQILEQIAAKRLNTPKQASISELMSEAILLLSLHE